LSTEAKPLDQISREAAEKGTTRKGTSIGHECRCEVCGETMSAIREYAEQQEKELEELRQWKKEQMIVAADTRYHEIAKEIGLTIGSKIAPAILPAIRELQAKLEQSAKDSARLKWWIANPDSLLVQKGGITAHVLKPVTSYKVLWSQYYADVREAIDAAIAQETKP
jgi:hypothetical protein